MYKFEIYLAAFTAISVINVVWMMAVRAKNRQLVARATQLESELRHARDEHEAELARADDLRLRLTEHREAEKRDREQLEAQHALELARAVGSRLPARLRLEQALSPELIEQYLAGTDQTAPVRAVLAHVAAKLVLATDEATGRPQVMLRFPDRTVAPYTTDDRMYDSGRAGGLAELLGELQAMTAAKEEQTAA